MIYGMFPVHVTAARTAKTNVNAVSGDERGKLVNDHNLVWQEHPVFGSCGAGRWVKKEESATYKYQVAEGEQPYLHKMEEKAVGKGKSLNNGYWVVHFTVQHSDRDVLVELVDSMLALTKLSSWREGWLFQDGVWQVVVNSINE